MGTRFGLPAYAHVESVQIVSMRILFSSQVVCHRLIDKGGM